MTSENNQAKLARAAQALWRQIRQENDDFDRLMRNQARAFHRWARRALPPICQEALDAQDRDAPYLTTPDEPPPRAIIRL